MTVEPRGGTLAVTVDGRAVDVEAVALGSGRWSLRLPATGQQHEVTVADGREAGVYDVAVGQIRIPVRRRSGRRRGRAGAGEGADGPQRLCAPMPGKIVRVLVKAGDQVAARQGVIVVEAMKMENELRAARAGVVRDVLVSEGASVDAGAPLVIIG